MRILPGAYAEAEGGADSFFIARFRAIRRNNGG